MITTSTLLVGTLALLGPTEASAESAFAPPEPSDSLEARIWLDRGVDPVLQDGDRARIYYRASQDAYFALFHIDTDGVARLLSPGHPDDPHRVDGGQDYRLLFPESSDWVVEEPPGVGYFFALAADRPFDFDQLGRSTGMGVWELADGGTRITDDPHLVMDQAIEILLGDGEFALDFTVYHVGEAYSYPRFLCYACHASEPFDSWNPYHRTCSGYRVVIHNDPYYYPAGRYRGERVVFPRPPERGLPQYAFAERGPGEPGTPLVVNRTRSRSVSGERPRETEIPMVQEALPTLLDAAETEPLSGEIPTGFEPAEDEPVRNRPVLQPRAPRRGREGTRPRVTGPRSRPSR